MKVFDFFIRRWWLFALVIIFLLSFYIRSFNIVPDRILSFDPVFQYRYTKYFTDWGVIPLWDELTYYVGRSINGFFVQPFMHYITSIAQWTVGEGMGFSLKTTASYMSAVYGALIAVAAFLVAKEVSNKYGGIMAAALVATAPQILIRTFGSSYDTDQIVLFFILLTLYAGFYMFKKRTVASYCLALLCFTGFLLSWNMFWFTFFIFLGVLIINFLVDIFIPDKKIELRPSLGKVARSFGKLKKSLLIYILLGVGIFITGTITMMSLDASLTYFLGFAQRAEAWIVNISIAELQMVNLADISAWILAMGRFVIGDTIIDTSIFLLFIGFIIAALYFSYKKSNLHLSFILTLLAVSFFTLSKGIRFSEFTSALFLVVISCGFGYLVEFSFKRDDKILKSVMVGAGIFIFLLALNIGINVGQSLGPDINSNWDNAWDFLRTQTPELSVVGTWWDPGHMITGSAERRVIADGAHCDNSCLFTINDRITDLGNIMVTSDENVSLELIRKYQGDSPEVYWIASDDLIGKFQWLQYFGTGCDARVDPSCPLYTQVVEGSRTTDDVGNIIFRNYEMGSQAKIMVYNSEIPIPIYVEGIDAYFFDEIIYYNQSVPQSIVFSDSERSAIIDALSPLERQMNFRFTNQSIPMSVWIPESYSYIVVIPQHLRESVFTKMFMLEGQGLEHFKQVFRNEQVKIYEVV